MPASYVCGTEGYAEQADVLVERYESVTFDDVHKAERHLIPALPCDVVDIGAGTGRDAAALAAMGHRVVAVEPTEALRRYGMDHHPSPQIEWIDDALPQLVTLQSRGRTFDIVLLTAVWMHLDAQQRRQAMPVVATLLRPGGIVIMSLRHGPVPPGRRMFDVSAEETIGLARTLDLDCVLSVRTPSASAANVGVTWTHLAFLHP
jgi:2-polyprenyl-3-methyl-5-hydroxy-6-metoxy-1,4-benzoquinol methylase